MTDAISYVIAAILLLQAVWRGPAALRGRIRERSLWGTMTAMSLAWLMRTNSGKRLVSDLGVHDLATLLKHLLCVIALASLFRYVTAVDAAEIRTGNAGARRVRVGAAAHRYAVFTAAAVSTAMATVFLAWLDRTEVPTAPQFLDRHSGEPALAVYMGLFYAFSGTVIGLCAYQWGSRIRSARGRALRTGLGLMTAGMIIGVAYAAIRIVYSVLAAVRPVSTAHAALQETVTDILLYCSFLFWGIGVLVPAARAARSRFATVRKTVRLHPLWRDLAMVNPDLVAVPPSRLLPHSRVGTVLNTARDVFFGSMSSELRLGRYVTEILDSILELRRRVPDDLYDRALAAVTHGGASEGTAEARARALWIKAALFSAHDPAGRPAGFPTGGGDSLMAEEAWLLRAAAAYAHISPHQVVSLLAEEHAPARREDEDRHHTHVMED
ncbi:MAB_1171c family putative transporter [Streptomyces sp. NPDC047023]|uniref:MAB_1171c family putative transporter n=1 Tax=Streptomyces sp. NPDC047023 TaxID=3155139 RepID=UPI0033BFD073